MLHTDLFHLENISLTLDNITILKPLSLTLETGVVTGLIGHNGSGKSSLLSLLASQRQPTQGRIYFQQKLLQSYPAQKRAQKIGYLPQHPPRLTGMTAYELVCMGRYPWHGSLRPFSNNDAQKVDEAIEKTHIESFLTQDMTLLSGGEAQRVWLAMLIAQQADCLLLDEPISALDIAHQIEVLNLVRTLARDFSYSIILVLHDLNMAARYCDHLIALKKGALIKTGAVSEVMTSDTLSHLYDIPIEVMQHAKTGALLYSVA